jgi:tRNA-uridine 2-sulfurtransferase
MWPQDTTAAKEKFWLKDHSVYQLLAGADPNKDQSYFLCQLNQHQLAKALFPIGHLMKPEVREIARREELPTAERKDSQGICFVGKVDLPTFLQQQLEAKTGNVIEIQASFMEKKKQVEITEENFRKLCFPYPYKPWLGKVIGEHRGAHFYTIGQRKGLNIGGYTEPLFVIGTDVQRNIVYVGEGSKPSGIVPSRAVYWLLPICTGFVKTLRCNPVKAANMMYESATGNL